MARAKVEAPGEEFLRLALCYPHYERSLYLSRLSELASLGVSRVFDQGPLKWGRWRMLGKGHTGLVVEALYLGERVALKTLRTDAGRISLEPEASLLAYANTTGVGPELFAHSSAFLLSELIRGTSIDEWLEKKDFVAGSARVIRDLLFQGFRLDSIGLDHGELSRPEGHVVIQAKRPVILDFESASLLRRCGNLTSLIQYLFIRKSNATCTLLNLQMPDETALIPTLRVYRKEKSPRLFRQILDILSLA